MTSDSARHGCGPRNPHQTLPPEPPLLLQYLLTLAPPATPVTDAQTNLVLITPEASLAEAEKLLAGPPAIEGLPVVDANKKVRLGGAL